jgi:hypothetical protein
MTAKTVPTVKTNPSVKPAVYTKQTTNNNVSANSKMKMQAVKPVVTTTAATMPGKTMATAAVKVPAAKLELPAGYEKINMTDNQRNRAMLIMNRYSPEISRLETQLNVLKAARDKELSVVLKPQEQTQLAKAQPASQTKPAVTAKPTVKK